MDFKRRACPKQRVLCSELKQRNHVPLGKWAMKVHTSIKGQPVAGTHRDGRLSAETRFNMEGHKCEQNKTIYARKKKGRVILQCACGVAHSTEATELWDIALGQFNRHHERVKPSLVLFEEPTDLLPYSVLMDFLASAKS